MNPDKNQIQSIKQRLKNLAEEKKISFDYVLLVYMNEGFLRRLEASRFNRNFILKGGFLLSSMLKNLGRTTRDLDFLGKSIANDTLEIKTVFTQICSLSNDDALAFHVDELIIKEIKEDNIYSGVTVKVPCFLDRSKQIIQIDIGFGDRVTPCDKKYGIMGLLFENPIFLFVYPLEAVIAEKFEAMITLDRINSRMKDFFDLYSIFQSYKVDKDVLFQSIKNTFTVRKTTLSDKPTVFTPEFYNDPDRIRMWEQFLKRINFHEKLDFEQIADSIGNNLEPIYTMILEQK